MFTILNVITCRIWVVTLTGTHAAALIIAMIISSLVAIANPMFIANINISHLSVLLKNYTIDLIGTPCAAYGRRVFLDHVSGWRRFRPQTYKGVNAAKAKDKVENARAKYQFAFHLVCPLRTICRGI